MIFKCKMCGGALEINNNESVVNCEYCGTQQTLPKLDDERRANLYDRANHFRRNNEFDKAMGIYEQILNEDNLDAEAYWSLVLCRYGIEYVEDPVTRKRVPTVNRAQFTSVYDDNNYKSALQYADSFQKVVYEEEAKAINEIQKGILAISQKEEPFDVFICYKETDSNGRRTPDSVLANDLYHQLTQEGFKVFFARITLEDKLGSAYEPYIFAALNSAKVMVALGTRPEYFKAVWVKNEWSRYLALCKQGEKKMLIPAYKDMDPYDLPEEFSHLQAQDMSKLGFMQDLIRGIKKILETDAPKTTVIKETVVSESNANTAPLLKRAYMFLEDGDKENANEYCERVLDIDPENAEAYLCKLMARVNVKNKEELKNQIRPFDGSESIYYKNGIQTSYALKDVSVLYEKTIRFADEALRKELQEYLDFIKYRNKDEIYNKAIQQMKFGDYEEVYEMLNAIIDFKDSKSLLQECKQEQNKAEVEYKYQTAFEEMEAASAIESIYEAYLHFKSLGNYSDSVVNSERCLQLLIDKIETEINCLSSSQSCYELIGIINKLSTLENREKYLLRIRELLQKKSREEFEAECKKEIAMTEIQIKTEEEYLESLYHGHRLKKWLIAIGVAFGITLLGFLSTGRDNIFREFYLFCLIFEVVAFVVLAIVGRPSTRPAIPRVKDELNRLNEQKEALENKDAAVLHSIKVERQKIVTDGGWICPKCGVGNENSDWLCFCGGTREENT